jgi:hypothetical protein
VAQLVANADKGRGVRPGAELLPRIQAWDELLTAELAGVPVACGRPQTCDWRCRACRTHGRPFYSHGDLLYLEHGTGPLAAELERLWRAKGTMKGGKEQAMTTVRAGRLCRGEQLGRRHAAPTPGR